MRLAVIGASNNKRRYSNRAVRLYREEGYDVVPVNPNEKEVEGLRCFSSVLEVPGLIDIACFYVDPSVGVKLVPDVIKKGIRAVYLNPGADSEEIVGALEAEGISVFRVCTPF